MNIRERKARQRKKANYALQHVRTDSWCMVDEKRLDILSPAILFIIRTWERKSKWKKQIKNYEKFTSAPFKFEVMVSSFCRKPIAFGTLAIHWNDDFAYKNKERMKI